MIFKKGAARQQTLFGDRCLTCGKGVEPTGRRPLYARGVRTNRFLGFVHYDCSTPDWYPNKLP